MMLRIIARTCAVQFDSPLIRTRCQKRMVPLKLKMNIQMVIDGSKVEAQRDATIHSRNSFRSFATNVGLCVGIAWRFFNVSWPARGMHKY